jgi:hypothetical protein
MLEARLSGSIETIARGRNRSRQQIISCGGWLVNRNRLTPITLAMLCPIRPEPYSDDDTGDRRRQIRPRAIPRLTYSPRHAALSRARYHAPAGRQSACLIASAHCTAWRCLHRTNEDAYHGVVGGTKLPPDPFADHTAWREERRIRSDVDNVISTIDAHKFAV